MSENQIKVTVTAVAGVLSSLLGVLYVPVLLLVACNLIDYVTGLVAAQYREDGGISSYKSMKGIFKKVMMWLLVVVGAIIDELLNYAAAVFGKEIPLSFLVACVVAIWIICNEIISILENMIDIGVKIPPFLMPLAKRIKRETESQLDITEDEDDKRV